jgi:tetrahydromethanopterin S-methyltransferase subunit D
VALGIAMLGGLYNLLVDFDRLAVSLVYGVPILLAMTAGLIAELVHYVSVGDAPAMMISPLRVEL